MEDLPVPTDDTPVSPIDQFMEDVRAHILEHGYITIDTGFGLIAEIDYR